MKLEARSVGLLVFLAALLLLLAHQGPSDIFLDFGPNDASYVTGFRAEFETEEPHLIHWSELAGEIRLPYRLPPGPLRVSFRYKRHLELPAEIRVFLGGRPIDRFPAPQTDFAVHQVTLEANPAPWRPLTLALLASSQDPRPLGLALDWLQVQPLARPVIPDFGAFAHLVGIVLGFYLFPRGIGFSRRSAWLLGAGAACALAAGTALHKLAPVHAASTIGLRFHAASLLVLVFFWLRRRHNSSYFAHPAARWALLAFYLGTALRLFALFHPEFYYPDVRTHSKFVSLIWTEGVDGFLANHLENQHRHLLGLQRVGEGWKAFPYPPLLYLSLYPLSLLQLPVSDWMKLVPSLLVGLEAVIVFVIAMRLGAHVQVAALASWFHATASLVAFRLTVASYAAIFGHFWDMLVALYLLFFFEQHERPWFGPGLLFLVAGSILSYAGSVLVLGLFIPAFCLAVLFLKDGSRPKRSSAGALRVASWTLGGALLAIATFYVQYVPELLPGWLDADPTAGAQTLLEPRLTPGAALGMAAHRLLLFYGPVYSVLLVLGLGLLKPIHHLSRPLALACLFSFMGLNFLRSGLGSTHIFQFSKDDLVLLPLATLSLGQLGWRIFSQARWARPFAAVFLMGWMLWGILSLVQGVRVRILRPDYPPRWPLVATPALRTSPTRSGALTHSATNEATATPGLSKRRAPLPNSTA